MRGLVWLVALAALLLQGAPAQDGGGSKRAADIARLIEQAKSGRSVIRPQAAARLAGLGEEAGRALLAAAGESTDDLAELGKDLVEVAGRFELPELRARLWSAMDDDSFPWRPSAAIGLAQEPQAAERGRFEALVTDPLSAVRNAAVAALGRLGGEGLVQLFSARLPREEDDRVRRTLAVELDRLGERGALWYLLRDLRRQDTFLGQPTGRMARLAAYPLLVRQLGLEDPGFLPVEEPTAPVNQRALQALEAKLEAAAGPRPELPDLVQLTPPFPDERLALELRSCRRGEFFLRWTDRDALLVGRGTPALVQLPPGTVAALVAEAARRSEALGDQRLFGRPGCDQETFHLVDEAGSAQVRMVAKGPAPVPDLRPAALSSLSAQLLASLPEGPSDDPRLDRLRERVAACLESIGGAAR